MTTSVCTGPTHPVSGHPQAQIFRQFKAGVLNVTHTDHDLTPELMETVKGKFESYRYDEGYAFQTPNRVDLLRKPISTMAE